jgi:hypothetical protein
VPIGDDELEPVARREGDPRVLTAQRRVSSDRVDGHNKLVPHNRALLEEFAGHRAGCKPLRLIS